MQERINEFRRQYDNIDPNYTGLRLSRYRTTVRRGIRTFYDTSARRYRSFNNVEVTFDFRGRIAPNFDNMQDLSDFVNYQISSHEDEGRLYQVNFSTHEYFQNYHPDSWREELAGKLREYERDEFIIEDISLRFTDRRVDLGNLISGNGDGVSIRYGEWILFDLMKSKDDCILNAFVVWMYYRTGSIDALLNKTDKQLEEIKRNYARQLEGIIAPYRFNDMDKILSVLEIPNRHKYIITSLDDLRAFNAEDTINNCVYYYSNSHCYLVMHSSKIPTKDMNKLRRCIDQTIVSMCTKRNVSNKTEDYYTMDIESYRSPSDNRNIHEPLLVGLYSNREFVQFNGNDAISQTLKWLYNTNSDCIIWAHNGGKYDWHFLFAELSDFVSTTLVEPAKVSDLDGALVQIQCYLTNGHTLTFKDSYRLLPSSLKDLGRDFGVKHQKLDEDIKEATREDILHSSSIREYNKLDCISLHEIMESYRTMIVSKLNINPLNYISAASFAKGFFYNKYYGKYLIFNPSKPVYEFIARAYSGGRNEVFQRGIVDGPLYVYDFTSLYPKAGTMMLPYGRPVHLKSVYIEQGKMDAFLVKNPGFYEVNIESPKRDHLPLHGVISEGKFIFPIFSKSEEANPPNEKTTVLFSEEIRKGLTLGYKYNIISGYKFSLGPVMKDCFEDLFRLRKEAIAKGNTALANVIKITINSAYGFNGFKKYDRTVLKVYGKNYEDHLVAKEMLGKASYKRYNDIFLAEERVNIHADNVSIAVAAAITSYARMILYDLISDLLNVGAEVYYVDTDSVITNYRIENDPRLKQKYMPSNGKEMGELKLVDQASEAVFITCKTYGYVTDNGEKTKVKGVKDCTYDALKSLVKGSIEVYVPIICTSRREKINRSLSVYDKLQKKTLSGKYYKGYISNDGKITPLIL